MRWIANARMYSVNPGATAAWRDLFAWLARASEVDLAVVDHAFPKPLAELWDRQDLGCAFMCGLPFIRSAARPVPIAAPVPAHANAMGLPVYATHLVARADSSLTSLAQTFGGRLGYTVEGSHSGHNALRHHLLQFRRAHGETLYRESVGPLHTPRRVVQAVLDGAIDVGPVDSLAFDLIRRHEPDRAALLAILDTTASAPNPLFVASDACPAAVVADLRHALLSFADDRGCADLRDRLCLQGFSPVMEDDYAVLGERAREAEAAGYDHPA